MLSAKNIYPCNFNLRVVITQNSLNLLLVLVAAILLW